MTDEDRNDPTWLEVMSAISVQNEKARELYIQLQAQQAHVRGMEMARDIIEKHLEKRRKQ